MLVNQREHHQEKNQTHKQDLNMVGLASSARLVMKINGSNYVYIPIPLRNQ